MLSLKAHLLQLLRAARPHLIVVALFYGLTVAFFYPVFFGNKSIKQGDIQQYRGSVHGISQDQKDSQEVALWNPYLFSGMPTYLVGVSWGNPILSQLHRLFVLYLPHPLWVMFACLVWSYVLLISFGARPLVALTGAFIFTFSSYFFIGIGAGHNARVGAMAYLPMILAGLRLGYGSKWHIGIGLCALGVAFQLASNHVQITYYTLFVLLFFVASQAYYSYLGQQMRHFWRRSLLLVCAGFLGFSTYYGQFSALYDYSKYSIRGERILTPKEGESSEGLDKSYAFQYSNEPLESMTLLIPNFYGGRPQEPLEESSHTARALRERGQSTQALQYAFTYWGSQPITSPYYVGVTAFFLLLLAAFSLKGKQKYWLLALGVFAILLTWGKHLPWLNYLLFDYLPGYNKFRSHTFATVIIVTVFALLAALALERALELGFSKKWWRYLGLSLLGSLGLLLLVQLFAGIGTYVSPMDERLTTAGVPTWYMEALRADRLALLRTDTWRGFFFVVATAALLYFMAKRKLAPVWGLLMMSALVFVDLLAVSTRYFNPTSSYEKVTSMPYQPSASDRLLMRDSSAHYRIFPIRNPFNDNRSSTFHRSVGGYHPAKLRRYQDIIEHSLSIEQAQLMEAAQQGLKPQGPRPVSDMLNVKYFLFGPKAKNLLRNPSPCGPAWFVERLHLVEGPDEEIEALREINPCEEATWDTQAYPSPDSTYDTRGDIQLQLYTPNQIRYQVQNKGKALLVMSEVYYPDWRAYVNGKEQEILRVNYLLRALELPSGSHQIRLEMRKDTYLRAQYWGWISHIGLLVTLLGLGIYAISIYVRSRPTT